MAATTTSATRPSSTPSVFRSLGSRNIKPGLLRHLGAKEALLANDEGVFFTTPHFDGYPAILVCLDRLAVEDLDEVIVEAWLARAPKGLVKSYLDKSL